MNYREEIETDAQQRRHAVWQGVERRNIWPWEGMSESDINRIWKHLHVMLDRQRVETTPAQKKRWAKRINHFARRNCLSRLTTDEIARRAERYIITPAPRR